MRLIDADALKNYILINNVGCGCSEDYQKSFLSAVEDQPTAVPDTVKDLVTIFQNSKDMKLIARDGDLRADPIVAGRMPFEWTPVSERLPDIDVPVLVTDYAGGVKEIEVDRCGQYDDSDERFWWNSQNPIAWMPLPECYRGENDGG